MISKYFIAILLVTCGSIPNLTSCLTRTAVNYGDASKSNYNRELASTPDSVVKMKIRPWSQTLVVRQLPPIPDIRCNEVNFKLSCAYIFHGEIFQRTLSASEIFPNSVGSVNVIITAHGKATFQAKKSLFRFGQARILSKFFQFDYLISFNAEISGTISCHGACLETKILTGKERMSNIHKNFKNENNNPAFPELPGIHFSSSIEIPWSLKVNSVAGTDVNFRQKYQIDARGHGTPLSFNVPKPEASFRNKFGNGRNTFPVAEFQASPHFRALVSHRRTPASASLSATAGLRLNTNLKKTSRPAGYRSTCDVLESTLHPFISDVSYFVESNRNIGLDEDVQIDTVPVNQEYSSVSTYPAGCRRRS